MSRPIGPGLAAAVGGGAMTLSAALDEIETAARRGASRQDVARIWAPVDEARDIKGGSSGGALVVALVSCAVVMRPSILIVLMRYILLPLLAQSGAEVDAAEFDGNPPECADPVTQQDTNYCAALEWEEADAELNRQWRDTVSEMQRLDAQATPGDGGGPTAAIRRIRSRVSQMTASRRFSVGTTYDGGFASAAPRRRDACDVSGGAGDVTFESGRRGEVSTATAPVDCAPRAGARAALRPLRRPSCAATAALTSSSRSRWNEG